MFLFIFHLFLVFSSEMAFFYFKIFDFTTNMWHCISLGSLNYYGLSDFFLIFWFLLENKFITLYYTCNRIMHIAKCIARSPARRARHAEAPLHLSKRFRAFRHNFLHADQFAIWTIVDCNKNWIIERRTLITKYLTYEIPYLFPKVPSNYFSFRRYLNLTRFKISMSHSYTKRIIP